MKVTGLGQQVVWGLYIAAFFTVAGAGAGLLAMVGMSQFRPILPSNRRTKMLWLVLITFIIAAFLILMDVGSPLRTWRIVTAFRLSAMMTWDFWALVIAGVVTLTYLAFSARVKESGESFKVLGILAIIAAVVLVIIEGLMLAELAARPLWGGVTLAGFMIGAVISGVALVFLALPLDEIQNLRNWMALILGASLVLVFSEVIAGLLTGNPRNAEEIRNLLLGSTSPFFWFHVMVGILLPLWLISRSSIKSNWLVATLALLGVLAEKTWVLAAGQNQPWLDLPVGDYFPTWVEFLAVVGVVAIGILAYQLIERFVIRAQKSVS